MSLLPGIGGCSIHFLHYGGLFIPKIDQITPVSLTRLHFSPTLYLLANISPAGRFRTFIYPLSSPASHHLIPYVYYPFHPQAVNNFEGDQAAAGESAGWQQPGAGEVPGLTHNCC